MSKEMSKRQMMREKRAKEAARGRWVSIGLIILGVSLVFILFLWGPIKNILFPDNWTPVPAAQRTHPEEDFNSLGSKDAPVTINEYSDFQCPYCMHFWRDTEELLISSYVETGKVRFVYNSFGSFIGAESGAAAEAAYCAGDQGKFWEMHDYLFTNQTAENVGDFSASHLSLMATAIGLDMTTYNSCVSSNKYSDRVLQDGKDGVTAGIQATPSFVLSYVVNGQTKTVLIEGAQPFSEFQAKIEAALAEIAAAQ
jgi:protein-disulfide isomerase